VDDQPACRTRRPSFAELRSAAPAILPSMLLCDFGNLQREVERLEAAGVPALHLDVMDGHFVPNLTYGLPIVEALRQLTDLPLDVHLMISQPERFVEKFRAAGADHLSIHIETAPHPRPLLEQIRGCGATAGLAVNPSTPVATIEGCLDVCDLLLVMSVEPGFGGQAFEPVALDKLRHLHEAAPPEVLLEVDGGVNEETIAACAEAGAELFVVGSAIFKHSDYAQRVARLADLAST
jgi:ribulose-phosphate 3-epimerase